MLQWVAPSGVVSKVADDHGLDGVIGDGPWGTWARFVQQPVHAARHKAGAPAAHHLGRDTQLLGHGLVVQTTQVTNPGTGHPAGAELERVLRTHFQLVGHITAHGHTHLCPRVVGGRVGGIPEIIDRPGQGIPDEPAGVWPGGIGGEARRGGGRRTVLVIRRGARHADNSAHIVLSAGHVIVGHAKSPDAVMDPWIIRGESL